jgi:hypothetical protein
MADTDRHTDTYFNDTDTYIGGRTDRALVMKSPLTLQSCISYLPSWVTANLYAGTMNHKLNMYELTHKFLFFGNFHQGYKFTAFLITVSTFYPGVHKSRVPGRPGD